MLKKILKKFDHSKYKTNTWKKHVHDSETGSRPETMIDKDTLEHLTSLRQKKQKCLKHSTLAKC